MSSRGPPVPSRNTSQSAVAAVPLPARRGTRRYIERQAPDRGVPENSEGYGSSEDLIDNQAYHEVLIDNPTYNEDLTDNPAYGVSSTREEEEGHTSPQPADPDEEDVTYY